MRHFLFKLAAAYALGSICAPLAAAQELRANVNLTITSTSSVAFTTSVQNNSTAPTPITSISWALSSGAVFDTFGTFSASVAAVPNPGANNDGQSFTAVVITPTSPLMPGQTLTTGPGGDIDSGTPATVEVRVTFSDGTVLMSTMTPTNGVFSASLIGSLVPTYPITVTWQNPTQNTDGTPYDDPASTKLYWGSMSGGPYANSVTINDPAETEYVLALPRGEYYLVATATNSTGEESAFSNQAKGVADPTPNAPSGLEQMAIDPEADGLAWLVFTVRDRVLFAEAGTAPAGTICDPQQFIRGVLPTDQMPHTLHLVAVEDVQLLPGLPTDGEFALFAECSVQ